MTDYIKIPVELAEGVLYALNDIQYSGQWYEFARNHSHPDLPLPHEIDPKTGLHRLKQIREAEAIIKRTINRKPASGFVYLIGKTWEEDDATIESVKIGFSTDPARRLKQLQTGSDGKLVLVGHLAGQKIEDEKRVHVSLQRHRIAGEWFRWCGDLKNLLAELGFSFSDYFHARQ